jgi:hypothetical protein
MSKKNWDFHTFNGEKPSFNIAIEVMEEIKKKDGSIINPYKRQVYYINSSTVGRHGFETFKDLGVGDTVEFMVKQTITSVKGKLTKENGDIHSAYKDWYKVIDWYEIVELRLLEKGKPEDSSVYRYDKKSEAEGSYDKKSDTSHLSSDVPF